MVLITAILYTYLDQVAYRSNPLIASFLDLLNTQIWIQQREIKNLITDNEELKQKLVKIERENKWLERELNKSKHQAIRLLDN